MPPHHYSKDLFLILAVINLLPQAILFFGFDTYNLPIFIVSLVISYFIWLNLTQRHTQKSIKEEVVERANLFIDPLQQATLQKNLEEPLLAKQNNNTQQINTRLNIASLYLFLCIVGIRQSKGHIAYTDSKQFTTLLEQTKPTLKKIYVARGTKTERIPEFINNNYQQIKQLIKLYWQLVNKNANDPTIAIQTWFEGKSHINLADKPYIYRNLTERVTNDIELKLLQALCRPKKHNKLLTKIKEKTETFMALLNKSNRFALQQNEEILDHRYIEKYLSAFLLIFGLVIIQESHGDPSYLQTPEYTALKNKATVMIKAMILNSRVLGVDSLTPMHITELTQFIEKQLPSLEIAYVDYFDATAKQLPTPEHYLLEWFKTTTKTELSNKVDLPFKLNEYVKQILSEETTTA